MPDQTLTGFGDVLEPSGDAVMAEIIYGFDWASTAAGPMEQWPEALMQATRLALLSPTPLAVLIGRDGLIICNDMVHYLFGPHYEGSIGKPIETVFPQRAAFFRQAIDRCFEGTGTRFRDEPMRVYRNGAWSPAWFHVAFTPIVDAVGVVQGVFLVVNESTARILAMRDLRRSQERLEIALDAGGIVGTCDLDVATDLLTCDERFARLFGLSPEEARVGISSGALVSRVHLDDRAQLRDAIETAIRAGGDYKCRYRVPTANGEVRWCFGAGRAVRDDSGTIAMLCGVVVDLTNQMAAEDALADSERRFQALIESIPQIVWSADRAARHDYFNSRWNEFTGLDAATVDGATWERLVHPDDWRRVSEYWNNCVATGDPYDIEYRFLHHSGRYRWLRVMALPVVGADGEITRWYGTSTDIEESKALELERELVANELEHRIRNLFALVNGLIMLSAREDPGFAPFAEQLQRRLLALHKAHSFIRAHDPARDGACSVQALARSILAPFEDAGRIVVLGDDAPLPDHLVTPLALVFHELATNSTKYGALACAGGSLSLRFRTGGGHLALAWVESGGKPADAQTPSGGFGSKLLTQTIERQLKGRFSRQLTPAGLTFEMEIPV